MKLLQLNTWSLHLAPAIVQLLDREDPDILCLQEVVSTESGRKMLGSIQEVLAAHEFEYYYFSPLVRFTYMHHAAERGNMILSKYPITFAHEFWTAGELQTDFTKDISYDAARNVVHAQVETPAGLLHVLTTHGYHSRTQTGRRAHARCLQTDGRIYRHPRRPSSAYGRFQSRTGE